MICLFSIQTWAQSGKLFNTDNQLSSNLATQVFQDKSGFIWIATRNGLNTYDGYNITVIKKNMSNFLSLNSNYINSIAQDEKEHILLGTNNSLLEFTGSEFLKIPMLDSKGKELATYVKQIYPLRNKDVAVATSGYGIMLKKQGAQECHAMKGEVEKLKYIHKLLEDKRGRLWIITEDGKLYRKETNGRVTSHFAGTEGMGAQDIQQDALGNLYLASKNQGVYLLRAGSNVFTRISSIGNLPIDNIYISRNNKLYIGCDGLGIYVYDPQTGFLQDNPLFSRLVKPGQEQGDQHHRRQSGQHLGEHAAERRVHAAQHTERLQLHGLPPGQPQRDWRKLRYQPQHQPGQPGVGGYRQGWPIPI